MIPHWLRLVSIFALVLGFAAAGVIMIDEVRNPQHMWIMNVVWPVVAFFGKVLTILAFASLYYFRHVFGVKLEVDSVEFWFMMQIAMLCGFLTSYPVNWWLLRSGIKEMM